MKKIFVLIFITCVIKIAAAQEAETSSKYTLKVYNMNSITHESSFFFSNDPDMPFMHRGSTTYRWFHPTIALQIRTKKNNFHEFELTQLTLEGKRIDARNMNTSEDEIIKNRFIHIGMRYEFMWSLVKSETSKINILLGMGTGLYFSSDRTKYNTIILEKSNDVKMGLELFLIPRVTYRISPRVLLDVNVPLNYTEFQYSINNRKYSNMNQGFSMIRKFDIRAPGSASYLRVGLGLNI